MRKLLEMNKSGRGACPRSSNPTNSGGKPLFLTCSSLLGHPLQDFFLIRATRATDDVNEVLLERHGAFAIAVDSYSLSQLVQRSRGQQLTLRNDGDVAA